MNKAILLYTLFCLSVISVKAQFTDNFSDGDFTNNPTWSGSDQNFEVTNEELRLNAPAVKDTSYLSTASSLIDNTTWKANLKFSFNPSSSNYAKFYVASNNSNLRESLNGYYIEIGKSSDKINFYKQEGFNTTLLIEGTDDLLDVSSVDVSVKVTRDNAGNWELFADTSTSCGSYVSLGTANNSDFTSSNFVGFSCFYTSTRSDKFFFDDISVSNITPSDNTNPEVESLTVLNDSTIQLIFSETISQATAENLTNYFIDNGIGNPLEIVVQQCGDEFTTIFLEFGTNFLPGTNYTVTVNNLQDNAGNVLVPYSDSFNQVEIGTVQAGDIIFNEIFADPEPVVGLPPHEYLELYNRSNTAIQLSELTLVNTTTPKTLPNFLLQPNAYVIVCNSTDATLFSAYGDVIGISSLTALANGGDSLTLIDASNNIIDLLVYDDAWHSDTEKKAGGWSLERINPTSGCSSSDNWSSSEGLLGGTPGAQNSIYSLTADVIAPSINLVTVSSLTSVSVFFTENILGDDSFSSSDIQITPTIAINNFTLKATSIDISFSSPIEAGVNYTITITDNIKDCSENLITDANSSFVLPEKGEIEDVIINEILFDPLEGGSDYVELYNNSNKNIDISNWFIATIKGDTVSDLNQISDVQYIIKPQEFVLLTENTEAVLSQYSATNEEVFVQIDDLPTFSNDEGSVVLVSNEEVVMDQFNYSDELHLSLLNNVDGVSLERINYNIPSYNDDNWHSAAEDIGFGTPGVQNSQYRSNQDVVNAITVLPKTFSPDNDGFDDFTEISYQFDKPGYILTSNVYTVHGNFVTELANTELLGTEGKFKWDGTVQNSSSFLPRGVYIIHSKVFNLDGSVNEYKNPVVIAYK